MLHILGHHNVTRTAAMIYPLTLIESCLSLALSKFEQEFSEFIRAGIGL